MLALLIPLILTAPLKSSSQPSAYLTSAATEIITFNDDGGWSWFEDERAIVDKSKVIIGSVAAGVRDQRSYAYLLSARSAEGFTPRLHDPASRDFRNLGVLMRFTAVAAER